MKRPIIQPDSRCVLCYDLQLYLQIPSKRPRLTHKEPDTLYLLPPLYHPIQRYFYCQKGVIAMSNENKIRILYVQPGKYPEERLVANELRPLQQLVGGYMQAVYPCSKDKVALVCNDSGKVDGLPLNRCIEDYDVIAGNFFICGFSGEKFCTSCYPRKCVPACLPCAA